MYENNETDRLRIHSYFNIEIQFQNTSNKFTLFIISK